MRADRVSGASEMALRTCAEVRELCRKSKRNMTRDELKEFAAGLVRAQPNMASIWNLANSLLLSDLTPESAISVCSSMQSTLRKAPKAIGKMVAESLAGKAIATNSSSRTVLESLLAANRLGRISVHLSESRPMREGLLLAGELARRGIKVTVYGDSSLARAVGKSDVAVAGADIVNSSGIVGKVGLMHLALCAKEKGTSTLVLADTTKFAPIRLEPDYRDPGEIAGRLARGIRVENVYFEEVPLDYFSMIVTESAKILPSGVAGVLGKIRTAPELRRSSR
ncbi:MAG: hypothetical protein ACUVT7_02630 [Thermoplasmata archaeon]